MSTFDRVFDGIEDKEIERFESREAELYIHFTDGSLVYLNDVPKTFMKAMKMIPIIHAFKNELTLKALKNALEEDA